MHMWIQFPNIGINLEHVGKFVSVFGFQIAYYGIAIGIGVLMGLFVASKVAQMTGQKTEDYIDLTLVAVFAGIVGARIYYVAFSWEMYKDDLLSIFQLREGGLAIYGGVIAAVITVFLFAKVKKLQATLLLDTACFGLVTGQMIGRWGNFFNREAFGEYTDSLLAMRLPVDAVRASDITQTMREHIQMVNGVESIQVHPTFLYESLWCLGVLILLFIYRKYKVFHGELFLVYLGGYGLGRLWIEGLRTDQLKLPGIGIPVSQLLAGILAVFSIVFILYMRRRIKNCSDS